MCDNHENSLSHKVTLLTLARLDRSRIIWLEPVVLWWVNKSRNFIVANRCRNGKDPSPSLKTGVMCFKKFYFRQSSVLAVNCIPKGFCTLFIIKKNFLTVYAVERR